MKTVLQISLYVYIIKNKSKHLQQDRLNSHAKWFPKNVVDKAHLKIRIKLILRHVFVLFSALKLNDIFTVVKDYLTLRHVINAQFLQLGLLFSLVLSLLSLLLLLMFLAIGTCCHRFWWAFVITAIVVFCSQSCCCFCCCRFYCFCPCYCFRFSRCSCRLWRCCCSRCSRCGRCRSLVFACYNAIVVIIIVLMLVLIYCAWDIVLNVDTLLPVFKHSLFSCFLSFTLNGILKFHQLSLSVQRTFPFQKDVS